MNIPPELLEIRRRHIDKAVAASIALQAGLITNGEFDSIVNLTTAWYRYIHQLYVIPCVERLASNEPAIVEGL